MRRPWTRPFLRIDPVNSVARAGHPHELEDSGMLRLDDQWIWDSWIADDGDRYHHFSLKAPRALGDPGLRHARSRVRGTT